MIPPSMSGRIAQERIRDMHADAERSRLARMAREHRKAQRPHKERHSLIYWLAFRFALVYWRSSELFNKIPGFNDGFEEAYKRHVERDAARSFREWQDPDVEITQ